VSVYGERERPRVLLVGLTRDEVQAISPMFASVRVVKHPDVVRQAEWDALISRGQLLEEPEAHLYHLSFGATHLWLPAEAPPVKASSMHQVVFTGESIAEELRVPPGLPPHVRRAVEVDLVPKERQRRTHRYLSWGLAFMGQITPTHEIPRCLASFLETTEPRVLAGRFPRDRTYAETWALPAWADTELWTRTALTSWRAANSQRFPVPWRESADWLSSREEEAHGRIAALLIERQEATATFDRQLEVASQDLVAAQQSAAAGVRRLLTAQHEELAAEVAAVLEVLGFEVTRMDPERPGDLVEDLRVSHAEWPDWVALVEVRGYTGGAKVSDLGRMHRFLARYEKAGGTARASCWYVCNQFLNEPPGERPTMFAASKDDVAAYDAELPLLLIDTRELFTLLKRAERDGQDRVEIRRLLKEGRGVFHA
jgi:hypothetical protein